MILSTTVKEAEQCIFKSQNAIPIPNQYFAHSIPKPKLSHLPSAH